jgi:hypothetical protein
MELNYIKLGQTETFLAQKMEARAGMNWLVSAQSGHEHHQQVDNTAGRHRVAWSGKNDFHRHLGYSYLGEAYL